MPISRPRRSTPMWRANGCRRCTSATTREASWLDCAPMSRATHVSETPATAWLRKQGVAFDEHAYEYVEHGGTRVSSQSLGVPEHQVVKTLVMQDEQGKALIVLMHGDRKVSTKSLARQVDRKRIEPCTPEAAQRHTGYQ